jgi:hypothetical protein
MSVPVFQSKAFVQSVLDPNMYYVIGRAPEQDFELDIGGSSVLMTPSKGFIDRGAKCYEWRPAYWMNYMDWRSKIYIRFYSP